jgi:hypothetical protein
MHAAAMLAEVVQTRPDLIPLGTVWCRTTKAPIAGLFGRNFVNAFLMPFKVIVGAKPFFSRTTRFLTEERFGVSKLVFPDERDQSELTF